MMMKHMDVAIVGGGLAGSTAAAMLARAGLRVAMIDPRPIYPSDFRCEKLDGPQVRLLEKTGLADRLLAAPTFDGDVWVARYGRLMEQRPSDQYGIRYDTLVNAVRAQIPPAVEFIEAKVTAVATTPERQIVTLSSSEELSARLVIMANGLNSGLRQRLGMARKDLSPCHSITLGFDLAPVGRTAFPFRAMSYYTERVGDGVAYLSLFPIGASM